MKLTSWFRHNVYPAQKGVYERKTHTGDICYSYWNGEFWCFLSRSIKEAIIYKKEKSFNQQLSWRGILKMKFTPWYSGYVKPVREGVYERNSTLLNPNYSYWNGSSWGLLRGTPTDAQLNRHKASFWQDFPWRGILK